MSTRLLLKGNSDRNNYKTAKIKGYAICIYSDASKYTSKSVKKTTGF